MTYEQFLACVKEGGEMPTGLNVQLQSLWYDGRGEWKKAHDLIDHLDDTGSAHVHAYLHRVEGDLWNARYWYNRAKQPVFSGSLQDEWYALVKIFLR